MTIEQAALLFDQLRYEEAEHEAREALADDPDNPLGLAVLSMILTRLGREDEATYEAEAAIGVAPGLAVGYVAHAQALAAGNQFTRARHSVAEAIRLEPQDPDNHALLAQIELGTGRWAEAYEASVRGLEIAPDQPELTKLRSVAAVHLGKLDEADEATIAEFRSLPEDPAALTTRAYNLLHGGRTGEAQQAFLSVLEREPANARARAGLIETMTAPNVIYALVLNFLQWGSAIGPLRQIALFFGPPTLLRFLRFVFGVGGVTTALLVVEVGWWITVATIWLAAPLSSLALLVHPVGRSLVSDEQRLEASLVAGLLVVATISGLLYVGGTEGGWVLAGSAFVSAVAVSAAFRAPARWPRAVLSVIAFVVGALGSAASLVALLGAPGPTGALIFYAAGGIAIVAMLVSHVAESGEAALRL